MRDPSSTKRGNAAREPDRRSPVRGGVSLAAAAILTGALWGPLDCHGDDAAVAAPPDEAHLAVEALTSGPAPFDGLYEDATPDLHWPSMGFFSTGLAVVDLDGDGMRDIVISNGNDVSPQPLVVHESLDGQFFPWPSWYAADFDHHGDLAVGDVNGDGWVDVAVSVMFGHDRRIQGGGVKIYMNREGTLEERPSFRTPEVGSGYLTAGCALGDVDGDADLDLAVAVLDEGPGPFLLDAANRRPGHARIYLNRDGAIERTPSWISENAMVAGDILLADVNQDGWMDLVVAATRTMVFHGGVTAGDVVPLPPRPSWMSADAHDFSYSVDVGRIGAGPGLALAVSSGCLTPPCDSRFALYKPEEGAAPVWTHPAELASKLLLADVNADEHLDLIAGRWGASLEGAPLWIFGGSPAGAGLSSSFSSTPDFVSRTSTVQEGIAVADLMQFVLCERTHALTADGPRAVITLPDRRIEALREVRRSGRVVPPSHYAWTQDDGWISVAPPLRRGERIEVTYATSQKQDIILANYHNYAPQVGNMIFLSRLVPACPTDAPPGAP